MLGRKSYTKEEIEHGRSAVAAQLAGFGKLRSAVDGGPGQAALDDVEPVFFNSLTLALDRPFVHRFRMVTGKDSNPLNEVELLVESLINNGGVLRAGTVVTYVPEQTVLGLAVGEPIRLTQEQFDRLSTAFFTELEQRFLDS